MDVFGDLFRGVRANGSLFGSSTLTAPWALHFVDGAPLTLCTVLHGSGWIVPADGPAELLSAHDTIVVRGPSTFTFVDELDTRAEPVACGEFCATPDQGGTTHRLGWRDTSEGDDAATTLIVGAYPLRSEVSRRLLDALPVVLRVDAGGRGDPVLDHLASEVAVDAPGQQVVLDRLLDWMLVCTLREWFDRPDGDPPTWWAAQRDEVVGEALRLLHADAAAPWTVLTLAERIGVSRSTLAKRFTDVIGEPPLTYLTQWRMTLAADLLIERETATLAEIARSVGYAEPFGFSAAFKRVRGVNPSEFRRTAFARPFTGSPATPRACGGPASSADPPRDHAPRRERTGPSARVASDPGSRSRRRLRPRASG